MKKAKTWIGLLLAALTITACTTSSLPVFDYLRWVESPQNGLHQIKTLGNIDFSIQYKPLEYLYAQENDAALLKNERLNEKLKQQNAMEFYTIRIAKSDGSGDILLKELSGNEEYYQRTNYYSFDFQQDIYRVQGGDTLLCTAFAHVPNYGIAPYIDFAVGFDLLTGSKRTGDITICIKDKVFDNGIVKFLVKQSDINNIPQLLIKK